MRETTLYLVKSLAFLVQFELKWGVTHVSQSCRVSFFVPQKSTLHSFDTCVTPKSRFARWDVPSSLVPRDSGTSIFWVDSNSISFLDLMSNLLYLSLRSRELSLDNSFLVVSWQFYCPSGFALSLPFPRRLSFQFSFFELKSESRVNGSSRAKPSHGALLQATPASPEGWQGPLARPFGLAGLRPAELNISVIC